MQTSTAQLVLNDKNAKVAMRMLGHQLLLLHGDSTSRVMPVEQEGWNFSIGFEKEFAFHPDSIIDITEQVFLDAGIPLSYIVEMLQCDSGEVVYSYKADKIGKSMIPCRGRPLPKDCYKLQVSFFSEAGTPAVALDIHPVSEEDHSSSKVIMALAVLVVIWLLIMFRTKRPKFYRNTFISIGAFRFNTKGRSLQYNNETIELTAKEADLLHLLYTHLNSTLERDFILNQVWGDEGAYIGRTLDVFISKLRKKLEADPKLKIVNIRGVGYKMLIA